MEDKHLTSAEYEAFELDELEREIEIQAVIEQLSLKSKSREYLEREVAGLRLELKRIEDEVQSDYEFQRAAFDAAYLNKRMGIISKVLKFVGGLRNREKTKAIKKAIRLWLAALKSGEVKYKDTKAKEAFIEKIQAEHPDIAKLSADHLSKNVLKYPEDIKKGS